jgi:NAD(P)-dependent dehydrogenase (short-subunit alcohol dehydrogenase family)
VPPGSSGRCDLKRDSNDSKQTFSPQCILITAAAPASALPSAGAISSSVRPRHLPERREPELADAAAQLTRETRGKVSVHPCDIRDPAATMRIARGNWQTPPTRWAGEQCRRQLIAKSEDLSPRAVDAVLASCCRHGLCDARLRQALARRPTSRFGAFDRHHLCLDRFAYVVPSAMAKAGVLAMTRSLAVEWGGRGIRLNAIAPGRFRRPGAWERLVPTARARRGVREAQPLKRAGDIASWPISRLSQGRTQRLCERDCGTSMAERARGVPASSASFGLVDERRRLAGIEGEKMSRAPDPLVHFGGYANRCCSDSVVLAEGGRNG